MLITSTIAKLYSCANDIAPFNPKTTNVTFTQCMSDHLTERFNYGIVYNLLDVAYDVASLSVIYGKKLNRDLAISDDSTVLVEDLAHLIDARTITEAAATQFAGPFVVNLVNYGLETTGNGIHYAYDKTTSAVGNVFRIGFIDNISNAIETTGNGIHYAYDATTSAVGDAIETAGNFLYNMYDNILPH